VSRFKIAANVKNRIDGVSISGGLAVLNQSIEQFPSGAFVVHDLENRLPDMPDDLKLIDRRDIQALIDQ
jgi:myo-inositol-hexaphosphate 3-phosphohydrolase